MYGSLEPTKAVTKGKPHVFETQSDNPNLNPLFSFYKLYYNLIDVWQFIFLRTDWSIVHKNITQSFTTSRNVCSSSCRASWLPNLCL